MTEEERAKRANEEQKAKTPERRREGEAGMEGLRSPSGPGGGTPRKEDLLREQELSTERQRKGEGWTGLAPGESSGTTPVQKVESEEKGEAMGKGGVPPSAHRAETEGERRREGRRTENP